MALCLALCLALAAFVRFLALLVVLLEFSVDLLELPKGSSSKTLINMLNVVMSCPFTKRSFFTDKSSEKIVRTSTWEKV